jgi:hypothetical protein
MTQRPERLPVPPLQPSGSRSVKVSRGKTTACLLVMNITVLIGEKP